MHTAGETSALIPMHATEGQQALRFAGSVVILPEPMSESTPTAKRPFIRNPGRFKARSIRRYVQERPVTGHWRRKGDGLLRETAPPSWADERVELQKAKPPPGLSRRKGIAARVPNCEVDHRNPDTLSRGPTMSPLGHGPKRLTWCRKALSA